MNTPTFVAACTMIAGTRLPVRRRSGQSTTADAADVTGRVFELEGGQLSVADGWHHGPSRDKEDRWDPAELGAVVRALLDEGTPPDPVYGGR